MIYPARARTSQYNDTKYTSPFIYHFVMAALAPSTRYYYQCGATTGSASAVLSFTTTPAVGASTPLVVGLIGDLGQTSDSAVTVQHMMADPTIQLSLLIGDLSYADAGNKPSKERPCNQDRWDAWGEAMQPLMSAQTVVPLPGNHEVEKSGLAEYPDFVAYQNRFRTPSDASGGETNLYFAFRAASAHFIALSSYSDFAAGSPQYQWLQRTLAAVDRRATPWLIVSLHAPWCDMIVPNSARICLRIVLRVCCHSNFLTIFVFDCAIVSPSETLCTGTRPMSRTRANFRRSACAPPWSRCCCSTVSTSSFPATCTRTSARCRSR